ncbi:MlaD family protein [Fundidesulfovibrio terrae]|uniref:MlaD family protein n=1 Tax=Fundidesulfovibrio terrae TaxID=2922866 RepID=UPI001FAEC4F9
MYSQKEHVKETIKASLAIALCLAILGTFVVVLGGYRFWEELSVYYIRFKNVKDLSAGRPVKYGGLDVGRILAIGVDAEDPRMIRVIIGLTEHIEMRQGVVARIAQKGLVGDYYVFLEPQGALGEPMNPGSFIPAVETVDMSQLAGMAGEILSELRPHLERVAEHLEQILSSENSERIAELLAKAPGMVDELRATAARFRQDFGQLAASGKDVAASASKSLAAVDKAVDGVKRELEKTLADIRGEVKQVGGLTDTVHKAVRQDQARLEDILDNVERVSADVKALSAKLRERPWEIISQPKERKP